MRQFLDNLTLKKTYSKHFLTALLWFAYSDNLPNSWFLFELFSFCNYLLELWYGEIQNAANKRDSLSLILDGR